MPDERAARERWMRIALEVWAVIGVLIILYVAAWLVAKVTSALVPFGIGLVIVLLLRRPVELLEDRGVNRTLAVTACYLAAIAIVAIVLTFIIPPIYAQVSAFIGAVPGYVRNIYALWDSMIVHPRSGAGVPPWLQQAALALRDQVVAGAGRWSEALAASAVSTGGTIASGVAAFLLALVIGFYTLADLPRLKDELMLLVGVSWRDEAVRVFATVTRVLGGWMRGVLIQSTVVAVLISAGLWIVGVRQYALAIGVIGGIINVVPYVGQLATQALAIAAGLFLGPWTALWAWVVVFAVNQFDGMFMAPRIMSDQVDLHPLLVIFSLLVGATLFGIPGMVLAVPIAAIIKGLLVYWFEKRTDRQITTDDGVLFRTPKDERADAPDEEPAPRP
jgi:predicted PurR-regulated permease PerM